MDGAWVRTWRPHHPWDPILAQFTSPRPKYSVPGTTGKTRIRVGCGTLRTPLIKSATNPFPFSPPLPAPFFLIKLYFAMAGRGLLFLAVKGPDCAAVAGDLPIWLSHLQLQRSFEMQLPAGVFSHTVLPRLPEPQSYHSRASPYTFRGAKSPPEDSCSSGPHCFVEPSMARNGKYMAPAYAICGLPKINTKTMSGPSEETQSDCPEMAFGSGDMQDNRHPDKLRTSAHGHLFLLFSFHMTQIKPQAPAAMFEVHHSLYMSPLIFFVFTLRRGE
ncbi:uncharacterized protein LOC142599819 [Balearica regulorum gibbericeps]|uniref:uncharacterized protein LOC142599819 n=1 Tax=Balearica regulorum gibbericeps TaxID=100784 RepID=UPI003F607944